MQLPQEFGIGLVNAQAAEIDHFTYPDWVAKQVHWKINGQVGQDENGYDLYELERGDEKLTVPANRLVFMARMMERLHS